MEVDEKATNQPGNIKPADNDKRTTEQAHIEADKDMEADAEFTASSPNDDLDEAESLKLGENTPLI